MQNGIIVKSSGGFYYVHVGEFTYECRARGLFRKQDLTPLVGDRVEIRVVDADKKIGYVEKIFPRKNSLIRPPCANIDHLLIVASVCDPKPDLLLIDKLYTLAKFNHIKPVLVINKTDLLNSDELMEIYKNTDVELFEVSTLNDSGIDALKGFLQTGINAFAGLSGVGKSSILNAIDPNFKLHVGEISDKIKRGKHTTRHVELYRFGTGYIMDTPGFSSLDILNISKEELKDLFYEFKEYEPFCKFNQCAHIKEKDCAVIDAVTENKIGKQRWENYSLLYEMVKDIKDWQRKKKAD